MQLKMLFGIETTKTWTKRENSANGDVYNAVENYTDMDGEVNDPFDAFFALPSVQEKLEKARENYRRGQ